jgi:hypothetical protein
MSLAEVFTGERPFSEITNDLGVYIPVLEGKRPTRPSGDISMPDYLWEYVQGCWSHQPEKRRSSYTAPEELSPPGQTILPGYDLQYRLCVLLAFQLTLFGCRWLRREQDLYQSIRIIERDDANLQSR